jgi:CxxC motif-containing protein (DUF1111 family)
MARRVLVTMLLVSFFTTAQAQVRQRAVRPVPPAPAPAPPVVVAPGAPFAGLTAAQRADFAEGVADFTSEEEIDEGLGPLFNERSCVACHGVPAVGGGSERTVTRFARRTNGIYDALANLGGSLMQDHAIGPADGSTHTFHAEVVPRSANLTVQRRSTPLFGLGLVDATPDSDFVALAAMQAASRRDGVAGRVSLVDNIRAGMKTVGKFGWKAQVPTLFQFAGDAYVNELGITTPDFPNESCPQGNCAELSFNPMPGINDDGSGAILLNHFMTLLGAPARGPQNRDTDEGAATFESAGCASCHVATLRTGSSPVAALDRQTYHPYSDFLLHDMGSLGDDIEQGAAKGKEMRTAPLWGLRYITTFLHDGRAKTLDQAIRAHDGEASAARERYVSLSENAKAKLMAFLRSL